MILWLAEQLGFPGFLNLFRYITFRAGAAIATALIIGLLIGPKFIGWLRVRQGKGQPIRDDGPQSHLAKRGTPTMGGLMILTSLTVSMLLWMDFSNRYLWACLFITVGFGMIGFLDDYDKVKKSSHKGVSGRVRLLAEFVVAGIGCVIIAWGAGTQLYIPFYNGPVVDLWIFYIPFGAFVVVAFGNSVNLTDGLDGLATMPVIIAAMAFLVFSYLVGRADYAVYLGIPHVPGVGDLTVLCSAIVGAGLAFLWFNAPPAAVFMGDTGSLALGGALGAIAVATRHEIVLGIVGGLFVVEALSVIIQVFVYKRTGKRVFRMAPIHHHFEQLGWSEPTVVIRFWIISFVLALAGLSTLKLEMITSPIFAGRKYAVLGLARSGLASVETLVESGAEVMAWDNREEAREAVAGKAEIADLLAADLRGYDGVVVSPGVPLNRHPIAQKAREAGVPIIGDIELFAQARASLPPHKVVGITGTNGKSTTTALVYHMCRTAGIPTTMAGNIGYPILGQDPLPGGGVYVLELSSYQLDLTHSLDCDVAVLLNVTPDHLDRYESFEAYRASKFRLFEMQTAGHTGVIGSWDPVLNDMAMDMVHGPSSWSTKSRASVSADDIPEWQSGWPALQGPHNAENIAAADAVGIELGIHIDLRMKAYETYRGLPHRMEQVARRDGILFVNDSKATNPEAAAPALAAYSSVHWILGGLAKSDDLGPCEAHLDHVRAAYTIGEAGPMFARLLEGKVPVRQCELLVEAVQRASRAAAPGEVVLLSPACASFDQFRDYEARGDAFRAAVEALS